MLIAVFVLGLLAALVVNSLADNLPPDALGVRHPPDWPRCRYCGAHHSPVYWLATVAYLARGGRCEHCSAPRRVRSAAVEILTGLSWAYLWTWAGGEAVKFAAAALIVTVFIAIGVIDIEHRLIMSTLSLPAIVLFGLLGGFTPERGLLRTLAGGLGGLGLTLGLFILGQLFSLVVARLRGQSLEEIAFGGGDVYLGALVGLAVGWPGVVLALILGVFLAGIFSAGYVVIQLIRSRYSPYAAIPYGPFLILGALVIYLYGKDLAAWYMRL